jgi:hypothetical protein
MTPIRRPLPKDKQSPLQRAKMAERINNRMNSGITRQSRVVPRQTVTEPGPKPAGYGDVPQIRPVSGPPSNAANPGNKISNLVQPMKKGGKVKCMAKGGSASKRADGCATKGKTKGRII